MNPPPSIVIKCKQEVAPHFLRLCACLCASSSGLRQRGSVHAAKHRGQTVAPDLDAFAALKRRGCIGEQRFDGGGIKASQRRPVSDRPRPHRSRRFRRRPRPARAPAHAPRAAAISSGRGFLGGGASCYLVLHYRSGLAGAGFGRLLPLSAIEVDDVLGRWAAGQRCGIQPWAAGHLQRPRRAGQILESGSGPRCCIRSTAICGRLSDIESEMDTAERVVYRGQQRRDVLGATAQHVARRWATAAPTRASFGGEPDVRRAQGCIGPPPGFCASPARPAGRGAKYLGRAPRRRLAPYRAPQKHGGEPESRVAVDPLDALVVRSKSRCSRRCSVPASRTDRPYFRMRSSDLRNFNCFS